MASGWGASLEHHDHENCCHLHDDDDDHDYDDDDDDKVIPLTPTCHEWRRAGALRLRTVRLVQQHRFTGTEFLLA